MANATAPGMAYHPEMWVELLRLVVWLAVVITIVSLIAFAITGGRL